MFARSSGDRHFLIRLEKDEIIIVNIELKLHNMK